MFRCATLRSVVAAVIVLAAASLASAQIASERIASGLNWPVFVTAPAGDARLFVVQQGGLIRILKNGALLPTPFLNLTGSTTPPSIGTERGLLGLAFHPQYATNGFLYVDYTDLSGNTVIARYHVSADPDVADPASATTLLTITQPYANHNGGTVAFSPRDGYLYIGMGDGGSAGDPGNRAQDDGVLLGKILRLDVDHGSPYAIPPDNPFAGPGLPLDEIWAKGVRNPYRFSFDPQGGDLYIADVGQSAWEEVDWQAADSPGGQNYGWRIMEGDHCYNPPTGCDQTGLTLPVYEYGHDVGCSITGGVVYRGAAIPTVQGAYFFADYCANRVWSFKMNGGAAGPTTEWTAALAPQTPGLAIASIVAIGVDGAGEMVLVDRGTGSDGELWRIVSSGAASQEATWGDLKSLYGGR
jgi:glucose/arabinose dehydrogenase